MRMCHCPLQQPGMWFKRVCTFGEIQCLLLIILTSTFSPSKNPLFLFKLYCHRELQLYSNVLFYTSLNVSDTINPVFSGKPCIFCLQTFHIIKMVIVKCEFAFCVNFYKCGCVLCEIVFTLVCVFCGCVHEKWRQYFQYTLWFVKSVVCVILPKVLCVSFSK